MIDRFLLDQVALVTGAARGIGFEIASELAQAGARVAVLDVREPEAKAAAQQLRAAGREAIGLGADVTRKDQVAAAIQAAIDQWGHIDILINNAGVFPFGPTHEMTEEVFDNVYALNVKVPYFLVAELAPVLVDLLEVRVLRRRLVEHLDGRLVACLHQLARERPQLDARANQPPQGRRMFAAVRAARRCPPRRAARR